MTDGYYLHINGAQEGPFTLKQLQDRWRMRRGINRDTLFFQEGMGEWIPLSTIEDELAPPRSTAVQTYTHSPASVPARPNREDITNRMKTCPFCAETDLQPNAKVCKHCGKDISEAEKPFYSRNIGCAPVLGVVFLIAGIFFWPLWILAVLLFILGAITKK